MNLEHHPREYHLDINKKDCNERAFQRAIIALEYATLDNKKVSWIDIELPIKEGKTKRFDLIGETPDGNYVLCELKFAKRKTKGDSPDKATRQVLQYKSTLIDYAVRLKASNKNFNLHTNATYKRIDINKLITKPIKIIIAANQQYWSYWRRSSHFTNHPDIEYWEINVDSEHFAKQSKEKSKLGSKYRPSMPESSRTWSHP